MESGTDLMHLVPGMREQEMVKFSPSPQRMAMMACGEHHLGKKEKRLVRVPTNYLAKRKPELLAV